jgi:hypothetical protein
MMRLDELPLRYRLLLKAYRWRRQAPVPCAVLRRPLPGCRVALVTSAGLVPKGAPAFDLAQRGGDWSYRLIDRDIDPQSLDVHHRSDAYDSRPLLADREVAFPLRALVQLADDGVIGSVSPVHLSFMGSITAPRRLIAESAPSAAAALAAHGVDIAVLVPV